MAPNILSAGSWLVSSVSLLSLIRKRTITIPANDKAFRKNTSAGPISATRIPPNAGPIPRPIFTATPFNVIAFLISLRGTALSKKGEKAGVLIASPNPRKHKDKW
jgi:hypothetical protein